MYALYETIILALVVLVAMILPTFPHWGWLQGIVIGATAILIPVCYYIQLQYCPRRNGRRTR